MSGREFPDRADGLGRYLYYIEIENVFGERGRPGKSEVDTWQRYKKPRDKLRQIVKVVIQDVYPPPAGTPASEKRDTIIEEIKQRMVKGGYWPRAASSRTIIRALAELGGSPKIKVRRS